MVKVDTLSPPIEELSSERRRHYSSNTPLTASYVSSNLGHFGEVILHCSVNITRVIRDQGNAAVLRYVCALLNSGGGILHMVNVDLKRNEVLSKHLDTWWSGMEIRLTEILSRDDICNYFDLVGNHDDQDLYLFVKTAEHLCTLSYHCRLPTDTATHDVTYQSMLRLLVSNRDPCQLTDLPEIPERFVFGQSDHALKKETKQIQFKQLKQSSTSLPERITQLMKKYISAFANHEGGHIYFGIDDVRASVIGEELIQSEQRRTEQMVEGHLKNMIWGHAGVHPVRGLHWDIQFYPVEQYYRQPSRVVVVVSIVRFPGGVFTHCPYSSYVSTDGKVSELTYEDWREAMLNPLRDIPELHHRFLKLPMTVPRAPLIFTLPDTIETIKQKVLLARPGEIQPRHYIESFATPEQKEPALNMLRQYILPNSLCFGMQCWGLNVPMMDAEDIICDIVMLTEDEGLCVLTLSKSDKSFVQKHSQSAAACFKTRLVLHGGCTDAIAVTCVVININDINNPGVHTNLKLSDTYPSHFRMNKQKYSNILKSLIITMGSYKAKSQLGHLRGQDRGYYFLLTSDQFELLLRQQFTRELWVHGPSGAGKTVAIIQMIEELRRRGCTSDNILYLAENEKLCDYLRSYKLCQVTNRRTLLAEAKDNNLLLKRYSKVCNVFIDEAQNFKARDGDWYTLAEKLANQKAGSNLSRCSNYFWLFMDYTQKVHKFEAGLPAVIGKNNFMLSEISRSTKEIFDFTSRLMTESEHVNEHINPYQSIYRTPRLAHSYSSGKGVDILSCKETEMKNLLSRVMSGLIQNGVQENDIAILVGKRKELDRVQSTLQDIHIDDPGDKARAQRSTAEPIPNVRSVDAHLKECGSEERIQLRTHPSVDSMLSRDVLYEDVSDEESECEYIETSNPFDILSTVNSSGSIVSNSDVSKNTSDESNKDNITAMAAHSDISHDAVCFYGNEMDDSDMEKSSVKRFKPEDEESGHDAGPIETGFVVNTVRGFDGLDKSTVIGINPSVNEDHADFKKFLINLASRAKDNLIIITTSDSVKKQLQQYTK